MYKLEKQIADQNLSADTFQERWHGFALLFVYNLNNMFTVQ